MSAMSTIFLVLNRYEDVVQTPGTQKKENHAGHLIEQTAATKRNSYYFRYFLEVDRPFYIEDGVSTPVKR